MTSEYESYKPLRNFLRKCNLEESLQDLWAISQHILNNTPLPGPLQAQSYKLKDYLYPWDLPLIAREIVLNADKNGTKRLNNPTAMRVIIDTIRKIENSATRIRLDEDSVMEELHRIGHRQFQWQRQNDFNSLLRYLKVFGEDKVGELIQSATGLSIREYYLVGLAITGHLLKRFDVNADQDYSAFRISREKTVRLFSQLSSPIDSLRQEILKAQTKDKPWEYSLNPLEAKPLIGLDAHNSNRLYCPVPSLLLRRVSQGLFYDLGKAQGYSNPFGDSFKKYIGEILHATFGKNNYRVIAEKEYLVGKDVHHGVDWIIEGLDANLFIECKTKRMRYDAKFSTDPKALSEDIDVMATAIVQNYKNIIEAEGGLSEWTPTGRPAYSLIVTLEDWFLFSPASNQALENAVTIKLREKDISEDVMVLKPYFISSSRELEFLSAAIAEVGIHQFFSNKASAQYRGFMLEPFSAQLFPNAQRTQLRTIFKKDWERLFPEPDFRPIPSE